MTARKTITAKKSTKAAAPAVAAAFRFPKRSDFFFDFPRRTDFGLPALKLPKLGNSAGVAKSWANEKVRAARIQKHGVRVTFDGQTTEHRSVAEAFRALRLPFEKHIKFRLGLKAAGQSVFESGGKMYAFALVQAAAAE
ncbi:hypothetical protein [Caballeronia sp. AZ10_KS36]|uniref:hypothetical protein n=1 Tax=Caballeronia sp. AZ10_KS36 TaxID=2921757 RepID=UPI002027E55A|nr:hypothetical protein [Caballeronia sp. AZ10_KS36]